MSSGIHPQGDALKKAVQWISEQRKQASVKPSALLADEAGLRFDLSPRDGEFLLRFMAGEDKDADTSS